MSRWKLCQILAILVLSSLGPTVARALTVNAIYDTLHPQSTGAFTNAQKAVFTEAASQWSAAIGASHTVTVTFVLASLGGPTGNLGFATDLTGDGGTNGSGRQDGTPVGATVFINDAITFFEDGTPGGNTEYTAQTPSSFLDGGPAAFDLLTVALHEISHSIGFDSDYEAFWSNSTTSPHPGSSGRPIYAFAATATSGDPAYDAMNPMGLTHGGVFLISSANEDEDFVNNGKTTHLDDVSGAAPGAGYFPLDLMNPGLNQQERRLIAAVDTDILCDAYSAYSCMTSVPEAGETPMLALALLLILRRLRCFSTD